jgi:hypothetical protein
MLKSLRFHSRLPLSSRTSALPTVFLPLLVQSPPNGVMFPPPRPKSAGLPFASASLRFQRPSRTIRASRCRRHPSLRRPASTWDRKVRSAHLRTSRLRRWGYCRTHLRRNRRMHPGQVHVTADEEVTACQRRDPERTDQNRRTSHSPPPWCIGAIATSAGKWPARGSISHNVSPAASAAPATTNPAVAKLPAVRASSASSRSALDSHAPSGQRASTRLQRSIATTPKGCRCRPQPAPRRTWPTSRPDACFHARHSIDGA